MNKVTLVYAMCVFCVLFCAYLSFQPPLKHRWTTTILKYRLALFGYATAVLCFFVLFSQSAHAFEIAIPIKITSLPFFGDVELESKEQSAVSGLIFTCLFLFVPRIRTPIEWIRKKFWEFAAIPKQAEMLSDMLMSAQYNAPEEIQNDTRFAIHDQDLSYEDLLQHGEGPSRDWIKLVTIYVLLRRTISNEENRNGEIDEKQSSFTRYRNNSWRCIEDKYSKQQSDAQDIFNSPEMVTPRKVADFPHDCNSLMREMMRLISCIAMRSAGNITRVHEEMEAWGFVNMVQPNYGLSRDDVTNLSIFVLFFMVVAFPVVRGQEDFMNNLGLATTVAITMAISVLCATVPKLEWPKVAAREVRASTHNFILDVLSGRKSYAYVLSGVAAMLFCFISISVYFALETPQFDLEYVRDRWQLRWPWLLLPFTNAFTVAFLVDNRAPDTGTKWTKKDFWEACMAGVVLGVSMWFVILMINEIDAEKNYAGLQSVGMILVMMIFGFCMGVYALLVVRPTINNSEDRA